MIRWKTAWIGLTALAPVAFAHPAADSAKAAYRLQNAGTVIQEILDIPDDIPQDLMDKARCVVVLPSVLKAAFIAGGSYGRGVMVCRTGKNFTGPWGAPAMYALEGGSFGFQIGGEATDFVILVMNNRGVDSLLHSKVKLGGDASIAAGPRVGQPPPKRMILTRRNGEVLYVLAESSRAFLWRGRPFVQMKMPITGCMAMKRLQPRS